jgi:hypothetical protein
LQFGDDRAELTGREETRSDRAGLRDTDGRQLSQRDPGGRRQMSNLPTDFFHYSVGTVRIGEACRLGRIRGGAQGVGSHVGSRSGLAGGAGGGHRGRFGGDLAGGSVSVPGQAASRPDSKLAAGKGSQSGDRLAGSGIVGCFRLK